LQLTAFGARDRAVFEVISCRAPSSAAEAQDVGPLIETVLCETQHDKGLLYNIEGYMPKIIPRFLLVD